MICDRKYQLNLIISSIYKGSLGEKNFFLAISTRKFGVKEQKKI
jgi:hypothetical protein